MLANSSGGYNAPTDSGQSNQNYSGAIPIDYNQDGLGDVLVPYQQHQLVGDAGLAGGARPAHRHLGAGDALRGRGSNAGALDIDGDGRQDLVWADITGFAGPQGNGDAIRYRLRNTSGAGFSGTVSLLVAPQLGEPAGS